MAFLKGVDRARYSNLLKNMYDNCIKGGYSYPNIVLGAYNLLTDYHKFKPYTCNSRETGWNLRVCVMENKRKN